MLKDLRYVGWFVAGAAILGWFFNTKKIRRIHHKEMDRVANVKSTMQKDQIPVKTDNTKK